MRTVLKITLKYKDEVPVTATVNHPVMIGFEIRRINYRMLELE